MRISDWSSDVCSSDLRFEGWFGSSGDFTGQQARGLVACPRCGSATVSKAPMSPAVPAKGNSKTEMRAQMPERQVQALANHPMPAKVAEALAQLAKAQEQARRNNTFVGEKFAEKSRDKHYGEAAETLPQRPTSPPKP